MIKTYLCFLHTIFFTEAYKEFACLLKFEVLYDYKLPRLYNVRFQLDNSNTMNFKL